MNWKDKVVFLTGASSGIGEASAIALAKKGATLGLLARRKLDEHLEHRLWPIGHAPKLVRKLAARIGSCIANHNDFNIRKTAPG